MKMKGLIWDCSDLGASEELEAGRHMVVTIFTILPDSAPDHKSARLSGR